VVNLPGLSGRLSLDRVRPAAVLAPLLLMGGALGGLEAMFLPNEGAGFWPADQYGGDLGRNDAPRLCTSIIFAFELTHDANVFLPLLVGSVIAHAFTVLTLKRSIAPRKLRDGDFILHANMRSIRWSFCMFAR